MPFPSWQQWRKWTLPSKSSYVGVFFTIIFGAFGVFAYFYPISNGVMNGELGESTLSSKQSIEIPVEIYNSLSTEAWVKKEAEFYILKPETPLSDTTIDAGAITLTRPENITSINGWYPVSAGGKIKTSFSLPRSKNIFDYFRVGGYKIRIMVRNSWSNNYGGYGEINFDEIGVKRGIEVEIAQRETPNK